MIDPSLPEWLPFSALPTLGWGRTTTSSVLARARARGIPVERRPTATGQSAWHVHRSNLPALAPRRSDMPEALPEVAGSPEAGTCLYMIILDTLRPYRVKVGASEALDARLAAFRTVCPEAHVLVTFEAPRACEGYALALASMMGARVGPEVFDFSPEALPVFTEALSQALRFWHTQDRP
jgi:hypothetical protein